MERKKMENAINCFLETNIALMQVHKGYAKDQKSLNIINKSIRKCRKAQKILTSIKHDDILGDIFASLFSGKEAYFAVGGALITSPNVKEWDTTEQGYERFLELHELGKKQAQEEYEKQKKEREELEKAKAEGKKIEYAFDPTTKTTKQVIVEDKKAQA